MPMLLIGTPEHTCMRAPAPLSHGSKPAVVSDIRLTDLFIITLLGYGSAIVEPSIHRRAISAGLECP
jgi:hypothetical protein